MIEKAGASPHCPVDSQQVDLEALQTLSYGLYVVTSYNESRLNGAIINTAVQVAGQPCQLSVSLNKSSLTHDYISSSGSFGLAVLEQETPMPFIGIFGFHVGREFDKFAKVRQHIGITGCPLPDEHALALFEARVRTIVDCGSHSTFIADVVASRNVKPGIPLTYAYYHEVKGGKTGKNAPTYAASVAPKSVESVERSIKMKKYVCQVCGYVYDPAAGDPDNGVPAGTAFEKLPDDWVCPVCGASKDQFEPES